VTYMVVAVREPRRALPSIAIARSPGPAGVARAARKAPIVAAPRLT
jgi:hypothetical protein